MKAVDLSEKEKKMGVRMCKKCTYLMAAQMEYHKLCMAVNRRFGGIWGWTTGVNGYKAEDFAAYYDRIGLDIETGLPIDSNKNETKK